MTAVATAKKQPPLIIIDMQEVFQFVDSQWSVAGYGAAQRNVNAIVGDYTGQIVWTKFIRDPSEHGSWRLYYDRWTQCRLAPDSSLWDITPHVKDSDHVLIR